MEICSTKGIFTDSSAKNSIAETFKETKFNSINIQPLKYDWFYFLNTDLPLSTSKM